MSEQHPPLDEWEKSENWRGGWLGLYHSRRDPRLLVPKRRPWMGWTLNTAHPVGRVLSALSLGLLVVALVYLLLDALG